MPKNPAELLEVPYGHVKSYTEIEAELKANGQPVPPGIAMLAAAEREKGNDPRSAALKWQPKLND